MKHAEVYQALLSELRTGKLAVGSRFASDARLMRRFGVSRATVMRAVGDLVRDGFLSRRRGSGTYVSSRARHGRIGLLIHGSDYCEFFAPFARRISHLCQRRALGLLFADLSDGPTLARIEKVRAVVADWIAQGVDGVLFQPVELVRNAAKINEQILSAFDGAGVPVVLVDSDIVEAPQRSR